MMFSVVGVVEVVEEVVVILTTGVGVVNILLVKGLTGLGVLVTNASFVDLKEGRLGIGGGFFGVVPGVGISQHPLGDGVVVVVVVVVVLVLVIVLGKQHGASVGHHLVAVNIQSVAEWNPS